MSSAERIRVMVLHADPIARAGLSVAFGRYPDFEVHDAPETAGKEGGQVPLQRFASTHVVVADYCLGMQLADRIDVDASTATSPKIVVIGGIDREWEIRSALERGVRGYLLVGCALDELVAGVRAVHRGARHLSPQVAGRLAECLSLEPLTTREAEVLRLVVEGFCNKVIGKQLNIAVGTVKSHLKSTFEKLGVESRTQAVAVAQRRGLLHRPAHQTRRWQNADAAGSRQIQEIRA